MQVKVVYYIEDFLMMYVKQHSRPVSFLRSIITSPAMDHATHFDNVSLPFGNV